MTRDAVAQQEETCPALLRDNPSSRTQALSEGTQQQSVATRGTETVDDTPGQRLHGPHTRMALLENALRFRRHWEPPVEGSNVSRSRRKSLNVSAVAAANFRSGARQGLPCKAAASIRGWWGGHCSDWEGGVVSLSSPSPSSPSSFSLGLPRPVVHSVTVRTSIN